MRDAAIPRKSGDHREKVRIDLGFWGRSLRHLMPLSQMLGSAAHHLRHQRLWRDASLAANPSLFPSLGKQPLCKIQSFLRLRELLLEALDHALQSLDARGELRGRRFGTAGADTSHLDRRPGNDRDDRYEWRKVQVAVPPLRLKLGCAAGAPKLRRRALQFIQ